MDLRLMRYRALQLGDLNLAREIEAVMLRRGIPLEVESAVKHETFETAAAPRPRGRPRKNP